MVSAIDEYEKLLEDLDDLAVIAKRRGEETTPHAEYKKGLKRHALSHFQRVRHRKDVFNAGHS